MHGGKMKFVALFVLMLTSYAGMAQDWAAEKMNASKRRHETVKVTYGDRTVEAVVTYPDTKEKRPAIVVIHTINGLIDWAKLATDELAEAGYVAIVPDLLSGMGPNGGGTADFPANKVNEAIGKLSPDQITADLNAVADYAKKLSGTNGKIMVAGFCWGGNEAFRFATNRSDLLASFVFYGTPPKPEAMAQIKAPVYGFFGGADNRVSSTVPGALENMRAAGKKFEPEMYDGAGHGFMQNGESPTAKDADAKARTDAWVRWKGLLASIK
jgi:carboxymethylenebutenolidase